MTHSLDTNIFTKIACTGKLKGQWIPHGTFSLTANPTLIPAKSLGFNI
jgi:hypothetical protein